MNLVGYTTTALSRNDIIDTPTNKNVVDGAIVELKDYDGNLVTIYDDINGTNPETQKTCDTNGQCTFFAEAGDYVLEVNGRPQNITISVNITVVNDVSSQRIWGGRYKGELTDDVGVTLADEFSVLLYDGNYYSYTGSDPFPVIVASGTVPTAPDYKLRNPTDHDSDINRNAVGAHESTAINFGRTGITEGAGTNLEIKDKTLNHATRVHIEPNGFIYSGTVSKQDWMFDDFKLDQVNYRILGAFLQTGDISGNGRNAEANITLKSAGGFYGGFPLMLWGYQDNSSEQAIAMKMLYMDIEETEKPTPNLGRWESGRSVSIGDYIQSNNFNATPRPTYGLYKATSAGTTGVTQPTHLTGTASDGGVTWEFVKDYFDTAAAKDLVAMILFGGRADYPVAGGHKYTAQFAQGLAIHQTKDLAFFDADGTLAGVRKAIGSDVYDYFKGQSHFYKYTDSFAQHVGGGTLRSVKSITDGDGQSNISVDVRGADTINLAFTQPTSIVQFICDPNQEFRIRVQNDNVVTLNDSGSLRMVNGTQTLGVRSVISFYARTTNQAIQDGYVGS